MRFLRFLRVLLIILAIVFVNIGAFCFASGSFYSITPELIGQLANLFNKSAEEFVALCQALYLTFLGISATCVILIIVFSIIIRKSNRKSSSNHENYPSDNSAVNDDDEGPKPVDLRGPALISTDDVEREYGDFFEMMGQAVCNTLKSETPSITYKVFYWVSNDKSKHCRVHYKFKLGARDKHMATPTARSQITGMIKEGIKMMKFKYALEITVDLE